MEEIIEIKNLSYNEVFNKLNISIEKNKFTTICGPNNCGKTTLIKLLGGKVFSDYFLKEYRVITILGNEKIIFEQETVKDEYNYYAQIYNNENKLKDLKKKFNIQNYQKENPANLPVNIKIKLKLLISLLQNPEILLLDDITLNLSKEDQEEILTILKDIKDLTIVSTTSNLNDAIFTTNLLILEDSKIILSGNYKDIMKKYNVLNKAGLNVPFMIDLSVKLIDYDLLNDIKLDIDEMVDELWK